MALRYFKAPETNFVPTYTPLNTQLLDSASSSIQKQTERFEDKRDAYDLASSKIVDSLSNLSETDRLYAQKKLAESRQSIQDIVENRGSRASMPFLTEASTTLIDSLKYHKQASELRKNASEALKESEAPVEVKNIITNSLGDVTYDDVSGDPAGIEAGFNPDDLEVASNWERFRDFLDKFNKTRATNVEEGIYSGESVQVLPDQTLVNYRSKLEYIDFNDNQIENISALVNDPKMRRQLELYSRARLENSPRNITVLEDGKIKVSYPIEEKTKDGKYFTEDGKVTENIEEANIISNDITYPNKEMWMATELVKPYSQRDAVLKQRYEVLSRKYKDPTAETSPEKVSNSMIYRRRDSFVNPEVDGKEHLASWYKELSEKDEQYSKASLEMVDSIGKYFKNVDTEKSPYVSFDGSSTDLTVTFFTRDPKGELVENTLNGTDEIISYFDNQIDAANKAGEYTEVSAISSNKAMIMNQLGRLEMLELRATTLDKQIQDAHDHTINKLKGTEKYNEDIIDALVFNPDGTVDLDVDKLPEETIVEYDLGSPLHGFNMSPQSWNQLKIDLQHEDRVPMKDGQKDFVVYPTLQAPLGVRANLSGGKDSFAYIDSTGLVRLASREGGNNRKIIKEVESIQQEIINEVTNAGEIESFTSIRLDPTNDLHKPTVAIFEHEIGLDPEQSDMVYEDAEGTKLDTNKISALKGHQFRPTGYGLRNGEPYITGTVHVRGTEDVLKNLTNVRITGESVNSMVENVYNEDGYQLAIGVEAFKNMLPELMEKNSSVSLTTTIQQNLTNGNAGETITVGRSIYREGGKERSDFVLTDSKGRVIGRAQDHFDIYSIMVNFISQSNPETNPKYPWQQN